MNTSYSVPMTMTCNATSDRIVSYAEVNPPFKTGDLNHLFNEYRDTIVNSLITAFGLDMILFKDIDGGNVQTVHNAERGVYSEEKFKQRGERTYNREDYASQKYMNKRRKDDFKAQDKIIDGYTGKELPKDGRAHLEHIVSAKEVHENAGMRVLMDKDDLAAAINSADNTTYTDASLNTSKKESELLDWASKPNRHNPELTNGDYYGVDSAKAKRLDAKARKALDQVYTKKKLEHYASSISKDALTQGGQMALRQGLGVVLTQVAIVIMDRLPSYIQEMRRDFSLETFIEGLSVIIKESFLKIKASVGQIFEAVTRGLSSGIFSSIVTALINTFFTTAKNIVKIIRQTMTSITEAVSILFFDKSGKSSGQKILSAAKVLLTGVSVVVGVVIDQGIRTFLASTGVDKIPVIGGVLRDVVSTFCGVLVTGLMSVTILYFLEHSDMIKKLIAFIDRIYNDCFDKALIKMNEANRLLDEYIAKLCELDFQALRKQISELRELTIAVDRGDLDFMYDYCKFHAIDLPFHNSEEFATFMSNKDEVFEI